LTFVLDDLSQLNMVDLGSWVSIPLSISTEAWPGTSSSGLSCKLDSSLVSPMASGFLDSVPLVQLPGYSPNQFLFVEIKQY